MLLYSEQRPKKVVAGRRDEERHGFEVRVGLGQIIRSKGSRSRDAADNNSIIDRAAIPSISGSVSGFGEDSASASIIGGHDKCSTPTAL